MNALLTNLLNIAPNQGASVGALFSNSAQAGGALPSTTAGEFSSLFSSLSNPSNLVEGGDTSALLKLLQTLDIQSLTAPQQEQLQQLLAAWEQAGIDDTKLLNSITAKLGEVQSALKSSFQSQESQAKTNGIDAAFAELDALNGIQPQAPLTAPYAQQAAQPQVPPEQAQANTQPAQPFAKLPDAATNNANANAAFIKASETQSEVESALLSQQAFASRNAGTQQQAAAATQITPPIKISNADLAQQDQDILLATAKITPFAGVAKASSSDDAKPTATSRKDALLEVLGLGKQSQNSSLQATGAVHNFTKPIIAQAGLPDSALESSPAILNGTSGHQPPVTTQPMSDVVRAHGQFMLNHNPQQPTQATPADQVSVQITKALAGGDQKISIQLTPEHLGKVDIQIEVMRHQSANIIIRADNAETLDILQRDARMLERALNDAGIKADTSNMQFNLRDGGGNAFAQQHGSQQYKQSLGTGYNPSLVNEIANDLEGLSLRYVSNRALDISA